MTSPRPPLEPLEPAPPLSSRLLAAWLVAGALAVVLAAQPSTLFDLDRFAAPKELALHLTALGALLVLGLSSATPRAAVTAADLPLLGFAAWSALSAAFAANRWLSTRALAMTLAAVVLFRAGRRLGARGGWRGLAGGLVFAVALAALTGLAQAYGFETPLLADSRAPGGTLGNRNFLAHLMAIGTPVALLLVAEARHRRAAGLAAVALGLMGAAAFLTRSRAGWLGFGCSMAVMGVAWLVARRGARPVLGPRRLRLAALAALLGVGLAFLLPNQLTWRSDSPYRDTMRDLANYREGSGRGRLIQYRNSLRLLRQDPVLGTGPGNWAVGYPRVTTPGDPSFAGADPMPTNPWPSSDWVAALVERGPIGALLLLAAFGAIALTALLRLRSEAPGAAARSIAALGVLTATLVTGAFDAVLLLAPPTLLAWAALGVLLPETRPVAELPVPTRGVLLPAGLLVLLLAAARSAGQVRAIAVAGPGWPVERLERAVRTDPGSYRLHLMIAQRTGCARALPHAEAAARLFPTLPAPARRLRACGARPPAA